jgi:hypothetical protein
LIRRKHIHINFLPFSCYKKDGMALLPLFTPQQNLCFVGEQASPHREGLLLLYKDMLFHTGVDAATLVRGELQLPAYY